MIEVILFCIVPKELTNIQKTNQSIKAIKFVMSKFSPPKFAIYRCFYRFFNREYKTFFLQIIDLLTKVLSGIFLRHSSLNARSLFIIKGADLPSI